MEPFIGDIRQTAFDFAPRDWAFCNGQLVDINENPTLYSLLGIQFGGDGVRTFALPDLRGRVPIHNDSAVGCYQGLRGGVEQVSLTHNEMPAHTHTLNAANAPGDKNAAGRNQDRLLAAATDGTPIYGREDTVAMNSGTTTEAGQSQAHSNIQPSLGVNYIIALQGIYPPRN